MKCPSPSILDRGTIPPGQRSAFDPRLLGIGRFELTGDNLPAFSPLAIDKIDLSEFGGIGLFLIALSREFPVNREFPCLSGAEFEERVIDELNSHNQVFLPQ